MKRLFAIIICSVLILCGCSSAQKDNRTLPKCFNTLATIEFDGMVYEAILTRLGDGYWGVELTGPDAVKGLIFDISGEETKISFKGLHFTFDTSKFPVGSVVSLVAKSFDRLAPLELEIIKGEATDFSSGVIDDITYSLTLDKNGTPLSLEFGNCGMKITFESFEETEGLPEVTTAN